MKSLNTLNPPLRRRTRDVRIGHLVIGGDNPILVQSMTVSNTLDTESAVAEIARLVEAGCPLVRLTAPSVRAAANLGRIRELLHRRGVHVALAADIHFTPEAAMTAADHVDKVRINPGNFAELRGSMSLSPGSEAVAGAEHSSGAASGDKGESGFNRIAERFVPLVRKLRERRVALRIGVNHGSLSERMTSRFGDTPEGMVQSALEYVRICRMEDFHQIVISMKSSIPAVTVAAYRLLVERMDAAGMDYPLHLGLTEAGDGLDGRIKSAVAVGALLADGIGDTIRVSLTEDSSHEIPAARALLEAVARERAAVEDSTALGTTGAPCGQGVSVEDPTVPDTGHLSRPWDGLPVPAHGRRRQSRPLRAGRLVIGEVSPVRVELRLSLDAHRRVSDGVVEADIDEIRRIWFDASTGPAPELISIQPSPSTPRRAVLEGLDLLRRSLSGEGSRGDLPSASVDSSPGTRIAGYSADRATVPGVGDPPPAVFLEWTYARQSEIHFLEAALPHVDGLSLRLTDRGSNLSQSGSPRGGNRADPLPSLSTSTGVGPDPSTTLSSLADWSSGAERRQDERFALLARLMRRHGKPVRWRLGIEAGDPGEAAARLLALFLKQGWPEIGFLCEPGPSWIARVRALSRALGQNAPPIFIEVPAVGPDPAILAGSALNDGVGDCICLTGPGSAWPSGPGHWREEPVAGAYAVLQACRLRMTRAEIIACPSCGRTLFDLQTVTARVRELMGHLAGVKIAVMGCIVNGPGEMADADFGYVGSGPGLVDLYVGRDRIRRGIPEEEAPDRLADLIRRHGRWVNPARD